MTRKVPGIGRIVVLVWLCAFASFAQAVGLSRPTPQPPPHVMEPFFAPRGGSNYLWYALGPNCDREPYGIVPNYHLPGVRVLVQSQLAAMHVDGMTRLSLGVSFAHGFHSGTLVDSSDPAQVAQVARNVAALLDDVAAAGFRGVLFRFFPAGAISPPTPGYDVSLVNEHFGLIQAVRASLVASGLNYLIDLSVEAAPRDSDFPYISDPWKYPANTDWSHGVRALWQLYYAAYGSADTIGFSSITDDDPDRMRSRVRHMRYVYDTGGGNPHYPGTFAIDVYGDFFADEAVKFRQYDGAMRSEDADGAKGWRDAPVIVAETFYDDPVAAENLAAALNSTGRPVPFLTEWPLDRGADAATGASCSDVNVAPPYGWGAFLHYGF